MKKSVCHGRRFGLLVCGMLMGGWLAVHAETMLRIMPLGDSITEGIVPGGYRKPLYDKLVAAGYSVDFVGTQTSSDGGLSDPNHEGHSGFTISDLTRGVDGWLSQTMNPHVILLLIGTNDYGQNGSGFDTVLDRLDTLLNRLVAVEPGAVIIVSSLLGRTDIAAADTAIDQYFNRNLASRLQLHVNRGEKVRYCDLHACVDKSDDLADGVHPNAAGYEKMAQGWCDAITAAVPLQGLVPDNQPAIVVCSSTSASSASFVFNTTLDAACVANSAPTVDGVPGGATASLSSDQRTLTLNFSPALSFGTGHALTIPGLAAAETPGASVDIAYNLLVPHPQGAVNYIPDEEIGKYRLVYALDIPSRPAYANGKPSYIWDNHGAFARIGRVAYYMELRKPGGDLQYMWVSMDAFEKDPAKIGVPVVSTGVKAWGPVSNLKIWSNVTGDAGTERSEGNVEFWCGNYAYAGTMGYEGARDDQCEWDDSPTAGDYGCMQVHDHLGQRVLLAFNHWGGNGTIGEVTIGNCTDGGQPDASFTNNSGLYDIRRLEVWAMEDVQDQEPPHPLSATYGLSRASVCVTFDEPVSVQDLDGAFALSDGTLVSDAHVNENDGRIVTLSLAAPLADAARTTLTVRGVRDRSARANPLATSATLALTEEELPASLLANVPAALRADFKPVYIADIPLKANYVSQPKSVYTFDQSGYHGPFDRVAYYMELACANGRTQWVWTAMDPFAHEVTQLGVPVPGSGSRWQKRVQNLDVASNLAGLVTGTGLEGNIEFFFGDYDQVNEAGVPNADGGRWDFGDRFYSGGTYGCMQVHNFDARQTLFAFNHFGADGSTPCVGIGNSSGTAADWTTVENATAWTTRRLVVLVRPSDHDEPTFVEAHVAELVPDAAGFEHLYTCEFDVYGSLMKDAAKNAACHTVSNLRSLSGEITRVAYCLELERSDGSVQWAWTAFDPFSQRLADYDVPTNTRFQVYISNLDVASNVPGITTGTGLEGNIEFFFGDFDGKNSAGIPNATGDWDWGDNFYAAGDYGCMQVHNYNARQTIWSVTGFNLDAGRKIPLGLGIGNGRVQPDWTTDNNAGDYVRRTLHAFAQFSHANTGTPVPDDVHRLHKAVADTDLRRVCLVFKSSISPTAAAGAVYSLAPADAAVRSAARSSIEPTDVILTLDHALQAGTAYTVTATLPDGAVRTVSFATPAAVNPEADILTTANIPELDDYVLVNELVGMPVKFTGDGYGTLVPYTVDRARFGCPAFDRVAYLLNLGDGNWVWTSMKAWTTDPGRVGVPTAERALAWQRVVDDLHVYKGPSANVLDGTFEKGCIEFYTANYVFAGALGLPGASESLCDFDDAPNELTGTKIGVGCMQVHNYLNRETVWSLTHIASANSSVGYGIGNNPNGNHPGEAKEQPDWTFTYNGGSYSVRDLRVFVRPVATLPEAGGGPRFILEPQNTKVPLGDGAVELSACAVDAASYQWFRNGSEIVGHGPVLTLDASTRATAGVYFVEARGVDGTLSRSASATVTLFADGTTILLR